MSTVLITLESHKTPQIYRAPFEETNRVLKPDASVPDNSKLPVKKTSSKIAIVGGGFGGLACALTCIKNLNERDFVIFERYKSFGGTWWANTYPGCASDIPSVWYSFFSELNSSWTELRPPQYEIKEYINKVVEKHNIEAHGRFEQAVTNYVYNESSNTWTTYARDMNTGQRYEHTSKLLVASQGGLVYPSQLKAPGLENFKGQYMHSATWDHSVSFKGKDIVVVGNGCSAAQVIPALLDNYDPKLLTQLVRSKHWIMPPHPKFLQTLYWLLSWSRPGIIFVRWFIAFVAELRYPMYRGTGFFPRLVRWINTKVSYNYMYANTPAKYRDMVIPEYKIGCKRVIYDYTYLPHLHDARLDLTNDPIDHIEEHHVVLKSGRRVKADIIVACTGYDLKRAFSSINLEGQNGFSVKKDWEEHGANAYETSMIKQCPNFFILGGPNSATGHSSVVLALENGCKYFEIMAKKVLSGEVEYVVPKDSAYDKWRETTQAELKNQVFGTALGGCVSWYTAGGYNNTAYPYSQVAFYRRVRNPNWNDLIVKKGNKKNV